MTELIEKLKQMVLTTNENSMVLYHGELYPKKEVIQEAINILEEVAADDSGPDKRDS